MGVERGATPRRRTLACRRHAGFCLLPRLGHGLVAHRRQRDGAEAFAGQAPECLVVGHAVARPQWWAAESRPDARVVGEVAVALEEVGRVCSTAISASR